MLEKKPSDNVTRLRFLDPACHLPHSLLHDNAMNLPSPVVLPSSSQEGYGRRHSYGLRTDHAMKESPYVTSLLVVLYRLLG